MSRRGGCRADFTLTSTAPLALARGQPLYCLAVLYREFRLPGLIPTRTHLGLALVVGALAVFAITPGASAQTPATSAQTPDTAAQTPATDATASRVSRPGPPALDPATYDARYADAIANASRAMRAEPLREEERVLLDGVLDEAVWQRAAARRRLHPAGSRAGRNANRAHRGPYRVQPDGPLHGRDLLRLRARQDCWATR